ncbi:hypothetical protein DSLASN_47190 [Desulfoluna limicola]|uniref:Uncharacterized protein n=1 Tax=Desulfoluna limicola TaxID=2810562 RepID=A0ABM7PNG7_9BACT|nr:hypothetical protein DSLASN_47190 [Desulfoluna limicola]
MLGNGFVEDLSQGQVLKVFAGHGLLLRMAIASGGPAGGQTFEKFDKQILFVI